MKYIFKKIYCATIVFVISLLTVFNCYAHENTANTEYNSEIVVEVDTYEDFLNYVKNPLFKYTFVIKKPPIIQLRNSFCYYCGKQTLTMNNYRTFELNRKAKGCPYNPDVIDHFTTWGNTYDLSCGSCGYRETIDKGESYTAYCLNSEGLDFMRTFEVRRNWTLAGGYEIHQCWSTWN